MTNVFVNNSPREMKDEGGSVCITFEPRRPKGDAGIAFETKAGFGIAMSANTARRLVAQLLEALPQVDGG